MAIILIYGANANFFYSEFIAEEYRAFPFILQVLRAEDDSSNAITQSAYLCCGSWDQGKLIVFALKPIAEAMKDTSKGHTWFLAPLNGLPACMGLICTVILAFPFSNAMSKSEWAMTQG